MPFKDPEKKKEYDRKYKAENRERINQKLREHYAKHRAHPRVLLSPEQRRANQLASYKKSNAKNKEKLKQYRQDNKEKISEYTKKYYARNKEAVCERSKKHYEANKATILVKHKEWREANADRHKQTSKEWREANKEHLSEKRREYQPEWALKRKDSLSYAKQNLRRGTNLRNKDIPIQLAEAKRLQLQIQRELKDANQRP
jgi:hypothetical protein